MPDAPDRMFDILFPCTGRSTRSVPATSALTKPGERFGARSAAGVTPRPFDTLDASALRATVRAIGEAASASSPRSDVA